MEELKAFELNLKTFFGNSIEKITKLFEKYKTLNNLKKSLDRIYNHHPNINLNYFKEINSKEKSYWLGFLFAEASLSREKNRPGNVRLSVELNESDEILLYRFAEEIGFNPKYIKPRKDRNTITLRLANQKFVYNLIRYGFIIGKKSKIIELPKLDYREFYLAFLLGFFDGDGITGTSKITSASIKFLSQIKSMFNLKSKPYLQQVSFEYKGKIWRGMVYRMSLGADLFNEMLENFQKSLERKRNRLTTDSEKLEKLKILNEKQILISKDLLQELVWEKPLYLVSELLGLSPKTLRKKIKALSIETPPKGWWGRNY